MGKVAIGEKDDKRNLGRFSNEESANQNYL